MTLQGSHGWGWEAEAAVYTPRDTLYSETLASDGTFTATTFDPASYRQIRIFVRAVSLTSSDRDELLCVVNGDTANNYISNQISASGSNQTNNTVTGRAGCFVGVLGSDAYGAVNAYAELIIDLPAEVSDHTIAFVTTQKQTSGTYTTEMKIGVGQYTPSAAITQILMTPRNSTDFKAGSFCIIEGIK